MTNSRAKGTSPDEQARGMSVNDFTTKVIKDVERTCAVLGKNYDKEQDRGFAFQIWAAELLAALEGIDEEAQDCVFKTNDLKIDLAMEDEDSKLLILGQTKYPSPKQKPDVPEAEVHDFFRRHDVLMKNENWFDKHASDELHDLLADYKSRLKNGWKVKFYFITTGAVSTRIKELVEALDRSVKQEFEGISFEIYDFYGIKELYIRSQSVDSSISEYVDLQFARGSYFLRKRPTERFYLL